MIPLKSIRHFGKLVVLSIALVAASAASADGDKKWDEQPAVKKSIAPKNPNKITGMVSATIDIDEKGFITSASINKATDSLLEEPVLEALKEWRFTPAKLDGKAISCTIRVPFKFNG